MKLFAQQLFAGVLCVAAGAYAGSRFRPEFLPALYAAMASALFAAAVLGSLWSRLGPPTPPRSWRKRAALGGAWAIAAVATGVGVVAISQGSSWTRGWFVLVAGLLVFGALGATGFLCGVIFNFFAELRGRVATRR